MDNHITIAIRKASNMVSLMQDLNSYWRDLTPEQSDDLNTLFQKNFPFTESLDDVCHKALNWISDIENELTDILILPLTDTESRVILVSTKAQNIARTFTTSSTGQLPVTIWNNPQLSKVLAWAVSHGLTVRSETPITI